MSNKIVKLLSKALSWIFRTGRLFIGTVMLPSNKVNEVGATYLKAVVNAEIGEMKHLRQDWCRDEDPSAAGSA